MKIDWDYIMQLTEELMEIPSPGGLTYDGIDRCREEFKKFGLTPHMTKKGALIAQMDGEENGEVTMISAHIDTLGAMVKHIKPNGKLILNNIGGFSWNSVEGENLTIHTSKKGNYTGSLLPIKSSRHTYGEEVTTLVREQENVEVRIDEFTSSKKETEDLGISIGDFVSFDTRTTFTYNGFLKSRYIDDKVCIAQLFSYIKYLRDNDIKPKNKVYFYISNYEELGHGVSVIPEDVDQFIALDIGLVSDYSNGDERKVNIIAKDSRTPYDFKLRQKLVDLCEEYQIKYTVDVHNRYGSDASIAATQGFDVNFSCIGPSVDSSHHYERTHKDGIIETVRLLIAVL
ncbi:MULTISPECIES: M42 family metallopeptidase [Psychrilyobacter]|uniref:M20/M25/M40 family metallo-hydrolase n=1 Tax=Psychrilyobacter piezotolerans TaxID=2293438 RepID=A0ABX9KJ33_9FUSO|nr:MULTISPECIES: M42 family metallopeptidase [Psychrilyobacter]MCS5422819.1 M42 family metallopeptidase [Psychrilyobacter sp. S5]NDI77188.1 M42 family metallopeptidase [Psychrilyobacter piezotolerans]RDE64204.1 M20/M25/M40 family metallo-hydrolase [Psychrilyobacter sp. S5]REI42296.1 M20/M25/M40 family metallo-hydrolase [Psychrilyobacter piezotolerans]